jgi:hypothetical protein
MPPATSAQAPRRPFQGPVYPRARTWLVRPRDPVRTAVQRVQRERSGLPRDPRLLSRRNSERASEELHGGSAWAGAGTEAERAREPQPSRRDGVQTPPKVLRLGCVGLGPASAGRTHGPGRSRTDVPMRVKSVDAALFLAKPLQSRAPYLNRSVISERWWASRRVDCDGGITLLSRPGPSFQGDPSPRSAPAPLILWRFQRPAQSRPRVVRLPHWGLPP